MAEPLDLEPIEARLAAVESISELGLPSGEWQAANSVRAGMFGVLADGVAIATVHGGWSGAEQQTLTEFFAAARQDVPALLAEVRRLRAAELEHLGMVGRAFTESARQVREVIAEGVMPAHLMRSTSMAVHPNRLVQLADRLDRQGEAAQVLADEAVPR